MMNKVIISGNLGADPITRFTQNGDKVANFSIASTEHFTNKHGERKKNTTWIKVTAFRGVADIVERHLNKGEKVLVEGKLSNRKYTDKDDIAREMIEVIALYVEF